MAIKLNHTIVHSKEPRASAEFLSQLFGGRGVYFEDPSGHLLEIITRPYADWPG